jgi:DsbC/DsbD-like thiol-disulfide interchange protein
MKSMAVIFLVCLVLFCGAHVSPAGEVLDLVTASLITEVQSLQPGEAFWLAVRLEMNGGWHVNWLNPGDAGLAPMVDWELPDGFEAGELQWPYPQKFALPELSIFGYEDEVFLLTEITPPSTVETPVTIKARVTWLACREACVPGEADLELRLEVRERPAAVDPRWASAFEKTRMALPVADEGWRFNARLLEDRLTITIRPPEGEDADLSDIRFFPNLEGLIENAPAQKLDKNGASYVLVVERSSLGLEAPSRIRGVLVSETGWGSLRQKAFAIDVPLE